MKIENIIYETGSTPDAYTIVMTEGTTFYCYDDKNYMCPDCRIHLDWDHIKLVDAGMRLIALGNLLIDLEADSNFEYEDRFSEENDGEWDMYMYISYEQWEMIYNKYKRP